mgnify:FL=1
MRRFRFDDDVTFGMAIVLLLLCCTLIGMVLGALLVA